MPSSTDTHSITKALHTFDREDQQSKEDLFKLVYPELKRMAHTLLFKFPAIETLSAEDLVAELYPKLIKRPNLLFLNNRAEFYRYAHRIMFNKLYDYKRGQKFKYKFESYDDQLVRMGFDAHLEAEEMQLLMKYIGELEESGDERKVRIATVASRRLFENCSRQELALMYNKDVKTITRDWQVFVAGWRLFKTYFDAERK